jgi:BirA family biotin operon repressor/biotin-[acetyl-CoA-carboxylase] ligase
MPENQPPFTHPLQVEQIERALHGSAIGQQIVYARKLPSTMPLAHHLVREADSPDRCAGVVVTTEEQTAGRGRLERRWEAVPGRALLISIVVAPPLIPAEPAQLPMIAALATLEATRTVVPTLAPHLWLKWPNDLLIVDRRVAGKLAGLLIESSFDSTGLNYAVIGIGINVNQRPEELPPSRPHGLPPTSLYTQFGQEVAREDLLVALCLHLNSLLEPSMRPDPEEIHRRWQATLVNLGKQVTVRRGEADSSPLFGRAISTTHTGSLIVEEPSGAQQIVVAGDAEFQWDLS